VSDARQYLLERVDDAAVVQVYADGFGALALRDRILVWHLYQAALAGRDIYYDQRHALNLEIRGVLEEITGWLIAHRSAIDVRKRDGKTYYVMVDAAAFRHGAGRLLAEVQRIKAEGDYAAAKSLFDTYGVHFDATLRDEVVSRVDALNLPSYTGVVMPRLTPRFDGGEIVDIDISYPLDLETQMLEYSAFARADVLATPSASR
jgi:hypothetical protein